MDLIVLKISDYTFNITFLIALLLGFGVILIFASNRFNQPTYNQDDKDPATQFLPKYLATRHEYSRSLMYYVFSLETIFIILSFAGPKLLVDMRWIDNDATTFESFPLWIALILTGLLPSIPIVKEIELRIRKLFHARAFIPDGAKKTADALARANFDFTQYRTPEILGSSTFHLVSEDDFDRTRSSIGYKWARTSCLMYRLLQYERDRVDAIEFDAQFFSIYRKEFEVIKIAFRALESRIQNVKDGLVKNDVEIDEIESELVAFLNRLYVFIGCAVRLSHQTRQEIDNTLNKLGFKLRHADGNQVDWNIIIVGLPLMALLVFAATLSAPYIFDNTKNLPYLPNTHAGAFKWTFGTLIFHGAAAIAAISWRARLLRENLWISRWQLTNLTLRPVNRYVEVAFVAALSGFLALVVYQSVLYSPSGEIVISSLSWSPLAGVTGFFIAYYFDDKSTDRWQRIREPILQAAVMAVFTYFIGLYRIPAIKNANGITDPLPSDQPFLWLMVGVAALVGFTLGAYLPHQQRLREKITHQDRIKRIEWEAHTVFSNQDDAQKWLETENPGLGGIKPIEAARTEKGLNDAMDILINQAA